MDSTLPRISNSQIKREARLKNQGQRNFGGKVDNFTDNKERHFNQRMLKAYLAGHATFNFGFVWTKNQLGTLVKTNESHSVLLTDKSVDPHKLDVLLANGYCDPGKVFGGVSQSKKQLKATIKKRLAKQA